MALFSCRKFVVVRCTRISGTSPVYNTCIFMSTDKIYVVQTKYAIPNI